MDNNRLVKIAHDNPYWAEGVPADPEKDGATSLKQDRRVVREKTDIVVIKSPRKAAGTFRMVVDGHRIEAKNRCKYLWVMFTKNLDFATHIDFSTEKVNKKTAQHQRLLPIIGGPGYYNRGVLCQVMHSVLLYAVPVWIQRMVATQRKEGLFRIVSAYRTVSTKAAQVIVGFPPIDLMVAERCFTVGSRIIEEWRGRGRSGNDIRDEMRWIRRHGG
ncbi:uncharacterized protein LOC130446925 [Diorhabda sublineata]|uniref:uncharacterized protein LOC130446925 n=1 Tax=Diorhabda sublineata TaxID=1163346 RepID=UPI0024E1836C|nr:uncharacterized protein LOC130446925 [Diorhabda sublineata]